MAKIMCRYCNEKFDSMIDQYSHICNNKHSSARWKSKIGSNRRSGEDLARIEVIKNIAFLSDLNKERMLLETKAEFKGVEQKEQELLRHQRAVRMAKLGI